MIILASESPRRAELLALLTKDFKVLPSNADERADCADPRDIVSELAKRKAEMIAPYHPDDLVLGADTIVYVDSEVMGKPRDEKDAVRMIRQLSAKTHEVWTGVCLLGRGIELREESGSLVTFSEVSEDEAREYVRSENVLDKAGAYAIQEGAAKFVERIDGSYTGIMGLPVSIVYRLLKHAGWQF